MNDTLKRCNSVVPQEIARRLSANNTIILRLYGLIKVHKPNNNDINEMPIRPVVSYTNPPTYNLAKWLNEKLKYICG